MFLLIGTVFHVVLAVGMRMVFGIRCFMIAAIFSAKELGELKYVIPGSITTLDKNLAMLRTLFIDPHILVQWMLPAVMVWTVDFFLLRKRVLQPSIRTGPAPQIENSRF